jgi:putative ABC transport system permease protein
MQWVGGMWRRLLSLLRRQELDRDLAEEIQFHLDMKARTNREEGMGSAESRSTARRRFGNPTRFQELSREAWGWGWIEELSRDLPYGVRTLGRTPGFTAVAVLTLALGIGANAAIFSVLYGVWLAPAPYPSGERLVDISMKELTGDRFERGISFPDLADWKAQSTSFEGFGLYQYDHETNVTVGGQAEQLVTHRVSANLFQVLGVSPVLGRGFSGDEDTASGPRSVLIGYGYWLRRFGGDPGVVGQRITVDGEVYTITGVMPAGFEFPTTAAEWSPVLWRSMNLPPNRIAARDYRHVDVVARLKPGVTSARAQAEMDQVVGRLAKAYPKENGGLGVKVTPLNQTRQFAEVRPALLLLMAAAAFILLIACVNIANLLLARAASRKHEFAVRRALGVSGLRLARQLLTETCLLSLAGGFAGVVIAFWALPALRAMMPASMPRVNAIRIDGTVLGFAAGLSLLTGLLFGVAPAWHAMHAQGFAVSRSSPRNRPARFLVAAEVALALVLLAGAGLLLESFRRASSVDFGFEREHVLTMKLELTRRAYSTGQRVEAFREELLRRASSVPGVLDAGTVSTLPLGHLAGMLTFDVDGRRVSADYATVSTGYLHAMRIPLLRGRYFSDNDRPGTAPVLIVSQSLARQCWPPGADALGKRIEVDDGVWFTIVGIVKDVRQYKPESEPAAGIYVLARQLPDNKQAGVNGRYMVLVLRTVGQAGVPSGSPVQTGIPAAIRAAVAEIDKDQPVADVKTMDEWVRGSLAGRRLNMLLLSIFAGLAVVLAAVGVFGVVSYSVTRRTGEIGIRMALGARPVSVLAMVARETLLLGLSGVGVGVAGTVATSRLLAGFLYGVKPADPGIVIAVAAVLVIVVVASGLIPARRAMQVDPVVALRQ